jgi:hypothetical protein
MAVFGMIFFSLVLGICAFDKFKQAREKSRWNRQWR